MFQNSLFLYFKNLASVAFVPMAGVGETKFPVGSTHKGVSVKVVDNISECSTWLNARKEGINEVLDCHRILNDIYDEVTLTLCRCFSSMILLFTYQK